MLKKNEARIERQKHAVKPHPYPAVRSISECRCFEPLCCVPHWRTHAALLFWRSGCGGGDSWPGPHGLWAEAMLGGRGDQGGSSGEGICTAGNGRDMPKSLLQWHFWEQLPLTPCPCLCCLEMPLPRVVSLSSCLLPVHVHRHHPTNCVLFSALQTPPGSRALPTNIFGGWGESKRHVRQVLTRFAASVPSPEWRKIPINHCPPRQPRKENSKHTLLSFQIAPALTFLLKRLPQRCPQGDVEL